MLNGYHILNIHINLFKAQVLLIPIYFGVTFGGPFQGSHVIFRKAVNVCVPIRVSNGVKDKLAHPNKQVLWLKRSLGGTCWT